MEIDSFVFYKSFYEAIKDLSDADQLDIYKSMCEYALFHKEIEHTSVISKSIFALIKPQLDANYKRRLDGNKGGRPKKTQSGEEPEDKVIQNHRLLNEKTIGYQSEKPNVNVNVNVNDNVNVNVYRNIVSYLNQKSLKHFQVTKKTKDLIKARLNDGFTEKDFQIVIDNKCSQWLNDPKMNEYLRPITLFGTKFESYLNARQEKDEIPIYDTTQNKDVSTEEEEELLKLMGKA